MRTKAFAIYQQPTRRRYMTVIEHHLGTHGSFYLFVGLIAVGSGRLVFGRIPVPARVCAECGVRFGVVFDIQ